MWTHLKMKFNRSSDVLKGIALDDYWALKLIDTRLLPDYLKTLQDLRDEYVQLGGSVTDREECAIIIQSLPLEDFGPSLISLQSVKDVAALKVTLLQWWDARWKCIIAKEQSTASVPNTLATAAVPGTLTCSNCRQLGHGTPNCWAKGGTKEGRAPRW
jgi:hypothetical protein